MAPNLFSPRATSRQSPVEARWRLHSPAILFYAPAPALTLLHRIRQSLVLSHLPRQPRRKLLGLRSLKAFPMRLAHQPENLTLFWTAPQLSRLAQPAVRLIENSDLLSARSKLIPVHTHSRRRSATPVFGVGTEASFRDSNLDGVGCMGLAPSTLPHHRTCGFPHPAVELSSPVVWPQDLMVVRISYIAIQSRKVREDSASSRR